MKVLRQVKSTLTNVSFQKRYVLYSNILVYYKLAVRDEHAALKNLRDSFKQ
jgi:hypothetical protein